MILYPGRVKGRKMTLHGLTEWLLILNKLFDNLFVIYNYDSF